MHRYKNLGNDDRDTDDQKELANLILEIGGSGGSSGGLSSNRQGGVFISAAVCKMIAFFVLVFFMLFTTGVIEFNTLLITTTITNDDDGSFPTTGTPKEVSKVGEEEPNKKKGGEEPVVAIEDAALESVKENSQASSFVACSDYKSTLQITWIDLTSGLGDRAFRIEAYGELATWLCATLIIPKTTMWLGKIHNEGNKVTERSWNDYLKTVRLSDGSSFLDMKQPFNKTNGRKRSGKCHYLYANPFNVKDVLAEAFQIRQANECFWWDWEDSFFKSNKMHGSRTNQTQAKNILMHQNLIFGRRIVGIINTHP